MTTDKKPSDALWPSIWVILFLVVFIWSAINPKEYYTWTLEVLPAFIGIIVLALTRDKLPLTTLCYALILFHCWVLMVGGHYTYAEVPLFDTLKEIFNQSRNNYDKVGHFMQGFVPAIVCREILIRQKIINGKYYTHFFTVCFCLAFSAFYELIEWWVALLGEDSAEAFLGTQGYVWDTQSDMAWALFGAIFAVFILSPYHDKQIKKINKKYTHE